MFPGTAPGSLTFGAGSGGAGRRVWTTVNERPWDLTRANRQVFLGIAGIMPFLANRGVDGLRLDAVAFMWQRLGTRCQSDPEVHVLLQPLRAVCRTVCPAVIHLGEAIVAPAEMLPYLGRGRHDGREGNLACHNSRRVRFWSALASRDTRLMTHGPATHFTDRLTNATCATYIRCHDDIGWAVTDGDAAAVGISGPAHRSVLAVQRILMRHARIAGVAGRPLIDMGGELALLNDWSYRRNPDHAHDSRWLHRPRMDRAAAAVRHGADAPTARVFRGVKHILARRRATPALHGGTPATIPVAGIPGPFAVARRAPTGTVLTVSSFNERRLNLPAALARAQGVQPMHDALSDAPVQSRDGAIALPPHARVWLTRGAARPRRPRQTACLRHGPFPSVSGRSGRFPPARGGVPPPPLPAVAPP